MHKQVHEFKLSCVRGLRTSAQRLQDLGQLIPKSVFHYLTQKHQSIISKRIHQEEDLFKTKQSFNKSTKENHMQMFRPNLENPANKEDTIKLNNTEQTRC